MVLILVKALFLILILFAVALEAVADIAFKKWAFEGKHILLALGLVIYFLGTVFWAVSLKYEMLSKAISIFTVLNLIIIVLVGVLYFHEHLSLVNRIGIGLGVLSVVLMEL